MADALTEKKLLGSGANGNVYLIEDESTGHKLALKRLATFNPSQIEAFKQEFSLLANLDSPGIAKVFNFGHDTEGYYFTEEYIEGATLSGQKGLADFDKLLEITAKTARALQYLHGQGIVHGDLKPENIFLTPESDIKIVDFGMANAKSTVGESGALSGTAAYMAPELFVGKSPTSRSDLYSLGVMLYELVSGCVPFNTEVLSELIEAHMFETALNPTVSNETIPRDFGLTILRLLSKDPVDRFDDPNDLIRCLNIQFERSFELGPELDVLDQVTRERLESSKINELYGEAIAYYLALSSLTAREQFALAKLYYQQGNWAQAFDHLKGLESSEAEIIRLNILIRQGEALQAVTKAEQLIQKKQVLSGENCGDIYNAIGTALYYLGEPERSKGYFEEALNEYRASRNIQQQSSVLNNIGNIYSAKEKWGKAEECYQQSICLSGHAGDAVGEGLSLMSLGYLFHLRGNFDEALEYYKKSYALLEAIGYTAELGRVGINLCNLYLSLHSNLKAQEILCTVEQSCQSHENSYVAAYANRIKGEVARKDLASAEAFKAYEESTELFNQIGSTNDAHLSCCAHIEALLEDNQSPRAQVLLGKLKKASGELSDDVRVRVDFLSARLFFALQQYDKALKMILTVEEELISNENTFDLLNLYSFVIDLYGALHASKEQRDYKKRGYSLLEELKARVPAELWEGFCNSYTFGKTNNPLSSMESDSAALVRRILSINKSLTQIHDVNAILEMIVDAMIDFTGAERGCVLVSDGIESQVHLARNMDQKDISEDELKLSRSCIESVMAQREALVTYDAQSDVRFSTAASVHQWHLRAIICLPLMLRGQAIGAIYLDNQKKAGIFDEDMIECLQSFADQAAVALDNAKLFSELKEKTVELQNSHEELQTSKAEVEKLNDQLRVNIKEKETELVHTKTLLTKSHLDLMAKSDFSKLIGKSKLIKRAIELATRVSKNDASVYIQGESGSGKELLARAIHFNSKRADAEFIPVNCNAIPIECLEIELFGCETKEGLFDLAKGGTLFFNGVSSLPEDIQLKVQRVIQGGTYDVRIISASTQDIRRLVAEGDFNEELFFLIHGVRIDIPPLRERMEDIPLFIDATLKRYEEEEHTHKTASPESINILMNHNWPGNVSELERTVYNAAYLSPHEAIVPRDLRQNMSLIDRDDVDIPGADIDLPLVEMKKRFEKRIIIQVLKDNGWNIAAAARQLEMARPQLSRMVKKYELRANAC